MVARLTFALLCLLSILPARAAPEWTEFEIDRLKLGGGINGDSLNLDNGRAVITWNRKPEGGTASIMQTEFSVGEFSPAIAVASGDETWWGGTALIVDGEEYLAVQRPGPEGYGYYIQGLSAGAVDLQWLADLSLEAFFEDFLVDDDAVLLAYSGLHEGEELRSLRLHRLVPGSNVETIIGPRAIWPALARFGDDLYIGYHNMINYGEDLGPSFGRFELAKVSGDSMDVVYQDETRLHNGLYVNMVTDEDSGLLWISYVNPSSYTYPPAAPQDQQADLLLIDGTPHVYYVDQPQATMFDSWVSGGYMELDTVRSYHEGGWIPAAAPKVVLTADRQVVLSIKAVEFSSGDGGLLALTQQR